MSLAMTVLPDLPAEMTWTLGGGTALALYLDHRESFDVDIFLEHPGALKELLKTTFRKPSLTARIFVLRRQLKSSPKK